jgi:hypothetical protein
MRCGSKLVHVPCRRISSQSQITGRSKGLTFLRMSRWNAPEMSSKPVLVWVHVMFKASSC